MVTTRHGTATVQLPSDTEILITRRFEAPRPLVWEALTTPRHLLRWWGPHWCPLVACEVDLRPGGAWRYVARDADGNELVWYGTYQEIVAPERIVSTEVFAGFPEAESLNTMTLTEADGVTTLQTLVRHSSREHRDGHVASGMEAGMQATFDRLDTLLDAAGTPAERYRRVAGRFTDRVDEMPDDAWDRPTPCEDWVGRDIVRHLVEWVPAILGRAGLAPAELPSVDDDPAGAWRALDAWLLAALDAPDVAGRSFDAGPPGELTVAQAIDQLVTGDVLIHTWDLARTGGLDETLDPTIVPEMLAGLQPLDDALRASGHFGPPVAVPDDADDQTRLIAFTGRGP
jgi:uncharacterized protein (TIGR03086 family)